MNHRGDIIYIDLPSPDLSPSAHSVGSEAAYDRPAVVVQADSFRHLSNTLLVVPGTTNLAAAKIDFTMTVEPSPTNGLPRTTVFIPSQVLAIDISRIRTTLGRLSFDDIVALDACLRHILEL